MGLELQELRERLRTLSAEEYDTLVNDMDSFELSPEEVDVLTTELTPLLPAARGEGDQRMRARAADLLFHHRAITSETFEKILLDCLQGPQPQARVETARIMARVAFDRDGPWLMDHILAWFPKDVGLLEMAFDETRVDDVFMVDSIINIITTAQVEELAEAMVRVYQTSDAKAEQQTRQNCLGVLTFLWLFRGCLTIAKHIRSCSGHGLYFALRDLFTTLMDEFDGDRWRTILRYGAEALGHLLALSEGGIGAPKRTRLSLLT